MALRLDASAIFSVNFDQPEPLPWPHIEAMTVPRDYRNSQDPEFRRVRARLAALALHHKRPEIAREAGKAGGEATVAGSPFGRRGWGVALALKRWYPTASSRAASRAPMAGLDVEGDGTPELGSATALSLKPKTSQKPAKKLR